MTVDPYKPRGEPPSPFPTRRQLEQRAAEVRTKAKERLVERNLKADAAQRKKNQFSESVLQDIERKRVTRDRLEAERLRSYKGTDRAERLRLKELEERINTARNTRGSPLNPYFGRRPTPPAAPRFSGTFYKSPHISTLVPPGTIEGQVISKKITNPRKIQALARQVLKRGIRLHPLLRVGMTLADLGDFVAWLLTKLAELFPVTRLTGQGLPIVRNCSSIETITTRNSYSSCTGVFTTPPNSLTSPYIASWRYDLVGTPGWQLSRLYGPLPSPLPPANRIPVRGGRDIGDMLRQLPPDLAKAVAALLPPAGKSPQAPEPDYVPDDPTPVEPSRATYERTGEIVFRKPGQNSGRKPEVQTQTQPQTQFPSSKPVSSRYRYERKPQTYKRFVVRVWKALDNLSEAAEKVDCIYKALPEQVQKDTKRGKRGLVDAAGQYGVDGADWKIPVIMDNIDDVDWGRALACIGLNEVEDKIIGGANRKVREVYKGPANMVTSEFGKKVSELLDVDSFYPNKR